MLQRPSDLSHSIAETGGPRQVDSGAVEVRQAELPWTSTPRGRSYLESDLHLVDRMQQDGCGVNLVMKSSREDSDS